MAYLSRNGRFWRRKAAVHGQTVSRRADVIVEELRKDEAIVETDTLLLTITASLLSLTADVMKSITIPIHLALISGCLPER